MKIIRNNETQTNVNKGLTSVVVLQHAHPAGFMGPSQRLRPLRFGKPRI